MSDPRTPDPRDPTRPAYTDPIPGAPYREPVADPRIANQTVVQPSSGRGGLVAAGVIAVLLVIALIAFTTGPSTDPGTTAVIPDQTTEEMAPAPEAVPAAPAPDASAPIEEAPADAAPVDGAPAADQ
jgi:hypothetical protein